MPINNDQINSEFNSCPIGISHTMEIQHLKDRLDMAIERLEEKMDDMKEDIVSLNASVNERFDRVDSKFDDFENQIDKLNETLPAKIDERIAASVLNKKAHAVDKTLAIILGIVSTVCGGIALVAAKMLLGLG